MTKYVLFVAILMGLVGCATQVVPTSEATVTTDIVDRAFVTPEAGKVPIVVKRDTGFLGGGCGFRIYADAKPVANLAAGQMVTIYLTPGEHILSTHSTGLCGPNNSELQIVVTANGPRNYRISIDQGMSVRLQATAF